MLDLPTECVAPATYVLAARSRAERSIASVSKGHCTAFAVLGNGAGVRMQAESNLELCYFLVLNARRDVVSLREQVRFTYGSRNDCVHVFDVVATRPCSPERASCRGCRGSHAILEATPLGLDRLAAITGTARAEIEAGAYPRISGRFYEHRGHRFHAEFAARGRTTFCPACLLEDARADGPSRGRRVGRVNWFFSPFRTCPVHGVPLYRAPQLSYADRFQWDAAGAAGFAFTSRGKKGVREAVDGMLARFRMKNAKGGPQAIFGRLFQWLQFNKSSKPRGPIREVVREFIRPRSKLVYRRADLKKLANLQTLKSRPPGRLFVAPR